MRFIGTDRFSSDILIIGGGGASLRAAIEAREKGADVLIASKSRIGFGNNTYISKSAFAASGLGDPADDPEVHLRDTVIGGRFLNDQKLVAVMAREARDQVAFLKAHGVKFALKGEEVRIDRTPGHTFARHVRTEPAIGSRYTLPLRAEAARIGVKFLERVMITRLFTRDNRIAGAAGVSEAGRFVILSARCLILTTGGYGQVFRNTNNAAGITGDGQALAYDLGLPLKDIEFVQFYPTGLGKSGNRAILYEAMVFRAGARLKNSLGQDIIAKHGLDDPMKVTRDRLARAITREIQDGLDVNGGVIMDLSPIPEDLLKRLSPLLPLNWPLDRKELIVAPTTHFCMGGLVISEQAETPLPGLFAAGEVCAGIHGANRLGGNALTEVWAMGGMAARHAAAKARLFDPAEPLEAEIAAEKARWENPPPGRLDLNTPRRRLNEVMWNQAGVIRDAESLNQALAVVEEIKSLSRSTGWENPAELKKWVELQNMLLMSEMICRTALRRTESRGSHYRGDFPDENNRDWLKNIVVTRDGEQMKLAATPVSLDLVGLEADTEAG